MNLFKKKLYAALPWLQPLWIRLTMKPKFTGWNMVTHAEPPWNDDFSPGLRIFNQTREEIKKSFEFGLDLHIDADNIDGLLWRHYNVICGVRYALTHSQDEGFVMVEAGVADGITAYFALKQVGAERKSGSFSMHLYDAWATMRGSELLESELATLGQYGGLALQRTRRNLDEFEDCLVFHQGYLPESLDFPPAPPDSVDYMHIDLNASIPTKHVLERFWPVLRKGGVILFDDYGWAGYGETRIMIDLFFSDREGILMKLPTGQAIYFR